MLSLRLITSSPLTAVPSPPLPSSPLALLKTAYPGRPITCSVKQTTRWPCRWHVKHTLACGKVLKRAGANRANAPAGPWHQYPPSAPRQAHTPARSIVPPLHSAPDARSCSSPCANVHPRIQAMLYDAVSTCKANANYAQKAPHLHRAQHRKTEPLAPHSKPHLKTVLPHSNLVDTCRGK